MQNKAFTFLQKNYGWIIALITGTGVCLSFVLKFIKYIYSMLYFDYYGISYELFNTEEINLLYNFCLSILLALCLFSLFYCYKQFYDLIINKIDFKSKTINVLLIIISNFFIALSSGINIIGWQLVFNMLLLMTIEIIVILVIIVFSFLKKKGKEKAKAKTDDSDDFLNYLKILPLYLLIMILIFSISYLYSLKNIKEYNVINDNKVIVYTTKDYHIVLDCEIKDSKITIYKGNQTKINNENVKSKLINFEEVKVQ